MRIQLSISRLSIIILMLSALIACSETATNGVDDLSQGLDPGSGTEQGSGSNQGGSNEEGTSSTNEDEGNSGPPLGEDEFRVVQQFPANSAVNIALVSKVSITFNAGVLANSFNDNLIRVTNGGAEVAGRLVQVNDRLFEFQSDALLEPSTQFTVSISDQVMSADGLSTEAYQWQFTTVADVYNTTQDVIDLCMNERDIAMLDSVNATRIVARTCGDDFQEAVGKLRWHCDLRTSSIAHSEDMRDNNFFDHGGSDGSRPSKRVERAGYSWRSVGENIAAGYFSVESVMQAWIDSPGHCRNLMSPLFEEFGFGYVEGNANSAYPNYWTQNFASPRNF